VSRDRYPRTLEEAFGPYERGPVEGPVRPFDPADRIVLAGSVLALVVLLGLALWGIL